MSKASSSISYLLLHLLLISNHGVDCFTSQTNIDSRRSPSSSSISSTSLWQNIDNIGRRQTFDCDNENYGNDLILPGMETEMDMNMDMESSSTRRTFLTVSAALSASAVTLTTQPQPSDALPFPLPFGNSKTTSLSIVSNTNATAASAIRQPNREGPMFIKGLGTESCLLKLLPVKKPVFRKLEKQILAVTDVRSAELEGE